MEGSGRIEGEWEEKGPRQQILAHGWEVFDLATGLAWRFAAILSLFLSAAEPVCVNRASICTMGMWLEKVWSWTGRQRDADGEKCW